ncbi:MAG TPA: hypothetical protein VJ831_15265, partial [Jatrophihabitantaceae bacterium]|nr:hypothetical protein [Jatrophihabitantaceae bacterium]
MSDLDVELRALGDAVEWPEPDLVHAIGTQLRTSTARPRRRRALVVALAAAAALVLAIPVSNAISSWVGTDGDHITVTPTTVPPTVTAAPSVDALDLGP